MFHIQCKKRRNLTKNHNFIAFFLNFESKFMTFSDNCISNLTLPEVFAFYLSRISLANELMESASMGSVIFPTTISYSAVFFLTTF